MTTKYDIGDKVIIEATVRKINVRNDGMIVYTLSNENWTNLERFEESSIAGKVEENESDK